MLALICWALFGITALLLISYLMARKDILIGFVPQGQIKAVMSGDSLHRMLVNVPGYFYDEKRRPPEIVSLEELETEKEREEISRPRLGTGWPYGIYWIGLPLFRKVLTYGFSWVKWDKLEGKEEFDLVPRDREVVNSLFFRYPYGVKVKKIQLKGNIEVNITLVVTLESVRPETTLFRLQPTGNWLGLAFAKITEAVRGWAGEGKEEEEKVDVERLRSLASKESGAITDFRIRVMEQNGEPLLKDEKGKPLAIAFDLTTRQPTHFSEESRDGILRLCGVRIIAVEFQNWEFVDPKVGEAFRSKETESQAAQGAIEKAKGQATAIKSVGMSEAAVIRSKFAAAGKDPNLVARLADADALKTTAVRVLSIGGLPPVHNVPVDGPTAAVES